MSVNTANGLTEITWSVVNQSIIDGYTIKRYIYNCSNYASNTFHTITEINNPNQFTYIDIFNDCPVQPTQRTEVYCLSAFNIEGVDTIRSLLSDAHKSIFLKIDYHYCNRANKLLWNNYIGWGNQFYKYEIFCNENDSGFFKIAEKSYDDTVFLHQNINLNSNYSYYIKAIRNDGIESYSNINQVFTSNIDVPEFLIPDSIITDISVNLWLATDINSETARYVCFKSELFDGNYDSIAGIDFNFEPQLFFSDGFDDKAYFYYITAVDYCGNEILRSDTVSNIFLNAQKTDEYQTLLNWTGVSGSQFQIFRSDNSSNIYSEIHNTEELNYVDNVNLLLYNQFNNSTSDGLICYYVVNEKEQFYNRSNTECVKFDEIIYIPNALNPFSEIEENRYFKPKAAFISDYELVIYNNFGSIIFSTNNHDTGWNGTLPNGKTAERGAYLYYLKFKNSKGIIFQKKSYLTLVY